MVCKNESDVGPVMSWNGSFTKIVGLGELTTPLTRRIYNVTGKSARAI